jgi:hypothetical protein
MIFNDLWNDICEATTASEEEAKLVTREVHAKSNTLTILISNKEYSILKDKDQNQLPEKHMQRVDHSYVK